jgi:predicted  nucleic acid-binding Zn-ribbon protein
MTNKQEIEWIKEDIIKYRIENAELRSKINELRSEIFKNEMKYRDLESDLWIYKVKKYSELESIKNNWFIKWIIKH